MIVYKRYKKIWIILLIDLVSFVYTLPAWSLALERFKVDPIPIVSSFQLVDAAGKIYTLEQFKGKKIILNFWATWCLPCLEEMPSMDLLQSQFADQLTVLPVSLEINDSKQVHDFYQQVHITHLPIYFDEQHISQRLFRLRAFPTSLIINEQGFIIAKIEGQLDWQSNEVKEFLGLKK